MSWPTLSILVVTYNRKNVLEFTLQALKEHLYYVGERCVVVADDGSTDGTELMIRKSFPDVTYVRSDRVGLGANTNEGLIAAFKFSDYVLQLQDDMRLLSFVDLHPHIDRLREDPSSGFIRLWGVGGHKYSARLEGNYWRVLWDSPELYITSDRPHVKHRRFHDFFGYYPIGLKTAETEEAWCHKCKSIALSKPSTVDVLVPLDTDTERSWEHVGWDIRWRDKGL